MIRHIVLFRLNDDISPEHRDELIALLAGLEGRIPELRSFEVHADEVGSERSASFGLISEFESWEGLRVYRDHPEHVAVVKQIAPLCAWIHAWDYAL